jgi:hypothetical protein
MNQTFKSLPPMRTAADGFAQWYSAFTTFSPISNILLMDARQPSLLALAEGTHPSKNGAWFALGM